MTLIKNINPATVDMISIRPYLENIAYWALAYLQREANARLKISGGALLHVDELSIIAEEVLDAMFPKPEEKPHE